MFRLKIIFAQFCVSFLFLGEILSQRYEDIPFPPGMHSSNFCGPADATPIVPNLPSNVDFQPIVQISTGKLQGKLLTTNKGNAGYAFLGIPYGEPTDGQRRFADPIPRKPWNGILNASDFSKICMQRTQNTTLSLDEMSEDCLTLNVFTPLDALENKKNYPILYFIYGSAWEGGSPRIFDSKVIIDNFVSAGLILITFQYRVGAMAFWTTGDEMGGNWAVKDCILGMQWTQKEIRNFGGDPDQVTIMGGSSGAVAVSLISMSPKTKGLFKRAVVQSGSATGSATFSQDALSWHRDFAISVGCAKRSEKYLDRNDQIVECMRGLDGYQLANAYKKFEDNQPLRLGLSALNNAPNMDGPNGLFPAPVDELLKNRHNVSTLVGATLNEYSMTKFQYPLASAETAEKMCDEIAEIEIPKKQQQKFVANACKNYYVEPVKQVIIEFIHAHLTEPKEQS